METIAVAARASRWAAIFVCSLGFAVPCAAGPFSADAIGPPDPGDDFVVAANSAVPASSEDVPLGSLATTDSTVVASISLTTDAQVVASVPPMATDSKVDADVPLVAGITRSSVRRGDAPVERVPGGGLLRADSLPVILESLLDQGILVPQAEKTYGALPGMFGTPPVLIAGPASQSRAREESQEFTWRETGFNVMRWTSAALAVLAVVGIVLVLVMPEVRRRLFFPDMPQMPPRPA